MYLTMDEIHEKYDGQWVFLINCQRGEYGSIAGGEVALCGDTQNEVLGKTREVDENSTLSFFTYAGKYPEGLAYL